MYLRFQPAIQANNNNNLSQQQTKQPTSILGKIANVGAHVGEAIVDAAKKTNAERNAFPRTPNPIDNVAVQTGRIAGGIGQGTLKTFAVPGMAIESLPQNVKDVLHVNGAQRNPLEFKNPSSFKTDKPITEAAKTMNTAIQNWTDSWVPPPQSGVAKFVANASDAFGEAVPATALAVATGGTAAALTGTTASWAAGGFNAFSTEMLEGKGSEVQGGTGNVGRAAIAGFTEVGVEALGGKIFGALADKTVNPVLRGAIDTFGEGTEEVLSGGIQAAVTGDAYSLRQAGEDFALGAAVGAGMVTGISGIKAISHGVSNTASKVNSALKDDSDIKSLSDKMLFDNFVDNMLSSSTKTDAMLTEIKNTILAPADKADAAIKSFGEKILSPATKADAALGQIGNNILSPSTWTTNNNNSSPKALSDITMQNASYGTWLGGFTPQSGQGSNLTMGSVNTQGNAVPSTPETEPWKFPPTEPLPAIPFPGTSPDAPEAPIPPAIPFPGTPRTAPEVKPQAEPNTTPEISPEPEVPAKEPVVTPPNQPEPAVAPKPEGEPSTQPNVEPESQPNIQPAPVVNPEIEPNPESQPPPVNDPEIKPDIKPNPSTMPNTNPSISPLPDSPPTATPVVPQTEPAPTPEIVPNPTPLNPPAKSEPTPDSPTESNPESSMEPAPSPTPDAPMATQIWTPIQVMEQETITSLSQQRDKEDLPKYDFNTVKGLGSRGQIYESAGYKSTFGGLSSY